MMTGMSSQDKFEQLREMTEQLCRFVTQAAEGGEPIHAVEQGAFDQLLQMGHQVLAAFVGMQGTGDLGPEQALPDGRTVCRLEQRHCRRYRSIFGDITIERTVYGTREGQKIAFVPLDERLGLPESDYSFVLQDWAQAFGTEHPFAKVQQVLQRIFKVTVPVDSLERMSRQMATPVATFRQLRPAPPPQEEGSILVVTADNKGIPMRRPAEAPPAGARRKKGEKANKKQMATVGCVYTVQPKPRTPDQVTAALFRERPPAHGEQDNDPQAQHKRICSWLSNDEHRGQDQVFAWIAQEVEARWPVTEAPMVCLMDGQVSLWNDQAAHLPSGPKVEILDLLHVSSRVWDAAHLFHREGSDEAVAFARERILRILQGTVGHVIGGLRQMATKQGLRGGKLRRLEQICTYFKNNQSRMRYHEYLAAGYPIATGVIEGACRYVIKDRMERAGMRWTVAGAQAMLDLRTTYINDQWEQYQNWRIEREIERLHPHRQAINEAQWPLAA